MVVHRVYRAKEEDGHHLRELHDEDLGLPKKRCDGVGFRGQELVGGDAVAWWGVVGGDNIQEKCLFTKMQIDVNTCWKMLSNDGSDIHCPGAQPPHQQADVGVGGLLFPPTNNRSPRNIPTAIHQEELFRSAFKSGQKNLDN